MKNFAIFLLVFLLFNLYCTNDYREISQKDFYLRIPKDFKHFNLIDSAIVQYADTAKGIYCALESTSVNTYSPSIEKAVDTLLTLGFFYVENLKKNKKIINQDTLYYLSFVEYDTGMPFYWNIVVGRKKSKYFILWVWHTRKESHNITEQIVNSFRLK